MKITLPQKNGSRIITPSSKLTIFCWAKNYTNNNAHKCFILFLDFLKLLIVTVAFFLGHHIYNINISCSHTLITSLSHLQHCLKNIFKHNFLTTIDVSLTLHPKYTFYYIFINQNLRKRVMPDYTCQFTVCKHTLLYCTP